MEFLLLLLSSFALFFFLHALNLYRRRGLPPSPAGLPIIENLLHIGPKPHQKTWRTSSTTTDQDHHDLGLGNLWKRAFNSQQLHHQQQQQQQQHGSTRRPEPSFGLSLANPTTNSDLTHFHNLLSHTQFRAPRMRWTTTLHARFVHAVELLGGHERATPKSVLELMDVKDLTLSHVKAHLQMYRTIKTTDRAPTSSGQSNVYENGSSGDNSDDIMLDIRNPRTTELSAEHGGRSSVPQEKDCQYGLWSNSSRDEAQSSQGPDGPPIDEQSAGERRKDRLFGFGTSQDPHYAVTGECSSGGSSSSEVNELRKKLQRIESESKLREDRFQAEVELERKRREDLVASQARYAAQLAEQISLTHSLASFLQQQGYTPPPPGPPPF